MSVFLTLLPNVVRWRRRKVLPTILDFLWKRTKKEKKGTRTVKFCFDVPAGSRFPMILLAIRVTFMLLIFVSFTISLSRVCWINSQYLWEGCTETVHFSAVVVFFFFLWNNYYNKFLFSGGRGSPFKVRIWLYLLIRIIIIILLSMNIKEE